MRKQIVPRAFFVRIQGIIDQELEVGRGRGRGRRSRRASVGHEDESKEFVRARMIVGTIVGWQRGTAHWA